MSKKSSLITLILILTMVLSISTPAAAFAQSDLPAAGTSNDALQLQSPEADPPPPPFEDTQYFQTKKIGVEDGHGIIESIISGPPKPPDGFKDSIVFSLPKADPAAGVNILSDVPTSTWAHGCSATSAAMIAGFYDRTFFSNMYTGPTNDGVTPINNGIWGTWTDTSGDIVAQNPLSATHQGVDGRAIKGHVDDYWIEYNNEGPDPFIGNWTEHTYGDCLGDYMKTNQSNYGLSDGATSFTHFLDYGGKLTCDDLDSWGITRDGMTGIKQFYESRGYTVTDCYNRRTDLGVATIEGGFNFDDYKAEIDAGYPVLFNVTGHTMVGVGYDDSNQTMYIHNTWDQSLHTMTWGGSYSNMLPYMVVIVHLEPQILEEGIHNDNDVEITYGPNWNTSSNASYYSGDNHYSNFTGNYANFKFAGGTFKIRYTGASNRGTMNVYVDNSLAATINQYNSSTSYQTVWTSADYPAGEHAVRLEHASGSTVDLDAIETESPPCVTLTLSHTGNGSDPTVSPTKSPNCANIGEYNALEEITVYAHPANDSILDYWEGTADDQNYSWTNTVLMPFTDHTVTAHYYTPPGPGTYENTNPDVYHWGDWTTWNDTRASGGSTLYSNDEDAYAYLLFNGRQASLIFTRYTTRGNIAISIDGGEPVLVNQYGSSLTFQNRWDSPIMDEGVHYIRVSHPGGTHYIDFDAFIISEIQEEPEIRIEPTVGAGAELNFSAPEDTGEADSIASLDASSQNELTMTFDLPEYEIINVEQEGHQFGRIVMPNSGTTMEIGKPELPTYGRFFGFPAGAQLEIEILDTETETISDVLVYPAQEPLTDSADYVDEAPFEFDEEFYSRDELYTGNVFTLDEAKVLRGTHLSAIRFYPFQYNPAQRELTVYKRATVRVRFVGSDADIGASDHRTESFDNLLQNTIVNSDQLGARQESIHQDSANGAEFLIITPPVFLTAANTLAAFRNTQGIDTEVRTTDQTGTTAAAIGNYIQTAYDTWTPAPEYVLFLGDAEFIPTNYQNPASYDPDGALIGTDLYYATVDGADYYPDIFTGRIPVDTLAQAQDMVDDIINYEQNPVSDPEFYENVSVAAYFQDHYYSSDPPADGYSDRRFVLTSEEIRDYLLVEGYTVERIYKADSTVTPTNYNLDRYANGEPLPADLLRANGFAWDGGAADISNAVNEGRFLLIHRDHGWYSGWGEPHYSVSDVEALTNGNRLPIVLSMNCQTGWFDNETDDSSLGTSSEAVNFSEAWIRNQNGGAIGVIGATRSSLSGWNDDLTKGIIDAIWPDFISFNNDGYSRPEYHMGTALVYGKLAMESLWGGGSASSTSQMQFELFHYFGDPTTQIYASSSDGFTIHNDGLETLQVTDLTTQNSSSWLNVTPPKALPFEILPGNSAKVVVTVDSSGLSDNTYTDRILVTSNDSDKSPYPAGDPNDPNGGVDVEFVVTPVLTPVGPGTYQNGDANIVYTGNWTNWATSSASGGSTQYSNDTSASASLTFSGRQVSLLYTTYTSRGNIAISIDGGTPVLFNQYGSSLTFQNRWDSPMLSSGTHTVKFYHPGGTKYIDLDAIIISDPESTPPAAVTLSAATGSNYGQVDLNWNAPGDDDMTGTATSYIVRYASSAIDTQAKWDAATDVTGEPTPLTAGTPQSMTVSGLNPGQTYFFALRTLDDSNNLSDLSNSPSATAQSPVPVSPGTYENDDPNIAYTGNWTTWTDARASGGSTQYSNNPAASATLTFSGRQVSLLFTRYTTRGNIEITIDGGTPVLVNQYGSALTFQNRWDSPLMDAGTHTVVLRHPGGTKYIDLDAIIISDPESIPPAAVTLSAATGSSNGQVDLDWNAPGDDDMTGTATSYIVRYASAAIDTQAKWDAASDVTGEPSPLIVGTAQSMTVSGLTPGQTYYFALRTLDDSNNLSALSNSPSAAAKSPTPVSPGTYQNDNPNIVYTGTWTTWTEARASSGSTRYSNNPAASATLTFSGRQVSLLFTRYTSRGNIEITIDGGTPVLLNQYGAALTFQNRWDSPLMDAGTHTVVFRHPGGTKYIDLDAIIISDPESIPPAAVTLSAATGSNNGQVNLNWNAPGDDDMTGTATSYIVRYAAAAIDTQAKWDAATDVTGEPTPLLVGTAQSMVVSGLVPGQTYFFALRALDDSNNLSALGNSPSAAAKAPTPVGVGTYENEDSNIIYAGNWTVWNHASASGGSTRYSNDPATSASLTFSGRQVSLLFTRYTSRGNIEITIDGGTPVLVNQYSSALTFRNRWDSPLMDAGTHTVEFSHPGGTKYIDLDAIIISDPESIPPAAVTLSAATGSSTGQVTLDWNSPGDDDMAGTALSYTVRYAASAIDSQAKWDAATDVTGEPTPLIVGTHQSMTVSGLTPGQTYFFALRSLDDSNNLSALSNSPSAQAKPIVPVTEGLYQETDPNIILTGNWQTWSDARASGGSIAYSNDNTATASLTFIGEQIRLIYTSYTTRGDVEITIDGYTFPLFSQYSSGLYYQNWLTFYGMDGGEHTIEFRHPGGTKYIDIDALQVFTVSTYSSPGISEDGSFAIDANEAIQP